MCGVRRKTRRTGKGDTKTPYPFSAFRVMGLGVLLSGKALGSLFQLLGSFDFLPHGSHLRIFSILFSGQAMVCFSLPRKNFRKENERHMSAFPFAFQMGAGPVLFTSAADVKLLR